MAKQKVVWKVEHSALMIIGQKAVQMVGLSVDPKADKLVDHLVALRVVRLADSMARYLVDMLVG